MAHWIGHHFGFEIRTEHQTFPSGLPGTDPRRIHDGSFHVVLTRGDVESTPA